jgi:hypothetical protein
MAEAASAIEISTRLNGNTSQMIAHGNSQSTATEHKHI